MGMFKKQDINIIPNRAGVYVLFDGDSPQFIGNGGNLRKAVLEHATTTHFERLVWFELPLSQIQKAEEALTSKYEVPRVQSKEESSF